MVSRMVVEDHKIRPTFQELEKFLEDARSDIFDWTRLGGYEFVI